MWIEASSSSCSFSASANSSSNLSTSFAAYSTPAISVQLSVTASIIAELYRAKAEKIKQLGWRELYEEETQTKDTIKAGNIPVKGKEYPVGTISMTEGTTNPPGRYTEGTLIDQMDKKGLERLRQEPISLISYLTVIFLRKKEMKSISHPKENNC